MDLQVNDHSSMGMPFCKWHSIGEWSGTKCTSGASVFFRVEIRHNLLALSSRI
jgi:hypothetical protein